jgi:hypothetical protein
MDSRTFCAYNETSKCFLSTRLTVVDAALEPLKVLKTLMEGLGPDAVSGIWLIHFKGVPVARALSPFDLIYLDKDFRVVHGVELSADSSFEPFRGQPSSALILPTKTITAAKTKSGNQINFREVYDPAAQTPAITQPSMAKGSASSPGSALPTLQSPAQQTLMQAAGSPAQMTQSSSAPVEGSSAMRASNPVASGRLTKSSSANPRPGLERPPIANVPSRVVQASVAKSINIPPEIGSTGRSANAMLSGRLLKSAPVHPEMSAVPQPSLPPVPEETSPAPEPEVQPSLGTIIPFPAAAAPPPEVEPPLAQVVAPPPPFKWDELQAPPSLEIESLAADPPASQAIQGAAQQQENALVPASQTKKKSSWDVRLLYWVFPEFDPSQEPEFRLPRADFLNEAKFKHGEPSRKLQFLSWLYPDLHLENVEKTRREERAATRVTDPGLVAYFFTGGSPRPHPVKNISVTGFYMYTDERWLPGTIIRITLQILGSSGDDPRDTITVHSRVVRWGVDGGGFEFVLPGFIDD